MLNERLLQQQAEHAIEAQRVEVIEAEMVERGFDPTTLPATDALNKELSTMERSLHEDRQLVEAKEADLQAARLIGDQSRNAVRASEDDLTAKKSLLQQHEMACGSFLSSWQTAGLGDHVSEESLIAGRLSCLEQREAMKSCEKKRQMLEQLAGLSKIEREAGAVSSELSALQEDCDSQACVRSHIHAWTSKIGDLQAEVAARQVDVVGSHLEHLEPAIQRLYYRLNPHPIFRDIRMRIEPNTRQLEVEAEASKTRELTDGISIPPPMFFSEAQMNCLAITVFLAGALRQSWSGLDTILIDDPIQQMDEMNVCAFLDLVRGLAIKRQFIVFTCSRDFYLLALDKLTCLNRDGRTRFLPYRLEGRAPAELRVCCDAS